MSRKQLGLMIDELTWMDETTKVQAKYEFMKSCISFHHLKGEV